MKSVLLTALVLFFSSHVIAEVHHIPVATGAVATDNFKSGNQFYELSLGGLENFLDALKDQDQKAYLTLKPDLQSLQMRDIWSKAAVWGGLAGGFTLMLLGAASTDPNIALMGIGTGLMIVAPCVGWFVLAVDKNDLLGFVNKHNRIRPQDPLQMTNQFRSGSKVLMAGIRINF